MSTDLPGAISRRSGKVRDIYDYGDGLLVVATDRISAFDSIMPNGIPDKGRVLNTLSAWWFEQTSYITENHMISVNPKDFPAVLRLYDDVLDGRAMWVRRAEVVQVECVVRGYLAGSGWKAYQQTGEVCGHKLPAGLHLADKLPEPIFTLATKAASGHDENISFDKMAEVIARQMGVSAQFAMTKICEPIRDKSLQLFNFASARAAEKGFLLCDTKFEFGWSKKTDQFVLADEIFTPDSSRWWDAAKYEPGKQQESFDKQYVRNYLESIGWNKEPPAPELPPNVVAETSRIYREALRRLTA